MAIQYSISKNSISIMQDVVYGIDKRLNDAKKNNSNIDECITGLKDLMLVSISELGDLEEEYKKLSVICEFLAKASTLAYLGMLLNDKDIKTLKRKSEEEYNVRLNEYLEKLKKYPALKEEKPSPPTLDFMFGFDELSELVQCSVEVLEGKEINHSDVESRIQNCVLGSIREISLKEYLSQGYLDKDIELIALLGNRMPLEMNMDIIEFIKTDNIYNSYLEDILGQVISVYKYLFQDGFNLRPYVGTVSFSAPYLQTIGDNFKLQEVHQSRTTFDSLTKALASYYDVNEYTSRQFDVRDIINSDSSKPMYYPIKMLEYTMGRELTYELSENVYRPHQSSDSWDFYSRDYVEPQIREYIFQGIYLSLERHFSLGGMTKDFSFNSEKFKQLYNSRKNDTLNHLRSDAMRASVATDINKLKKSLCTIVLVAQYNSLGSKVNSITLRIVNTTNNVKTSLTKTLFGHISENEKVQYSEGYLISEGKVVNGKDDPLPFDIIEFSHDYDSALANAEPLFGYKAVEMFKERGKQLSWDRILLGEDLKRTPIFASKGDIDDLPMQKQFVHNMMAGTRAGKGVMTMNMLVSGIASKKPIFYLDRKPDMAVMFRELTQGNMFIVNGGQYDANRDPRGVLQAGLSTSHDFDNLIQTMPSYIDSTIFPSRTYYGDKGQIGDLVYFRAIILCLGIIMARIECSNNSEIYNSLGGNTGIIVVIDEFKNWQEVFERTYFAPSGIFGNDHRVRLAEVRERRDKILEKIETKHIELEYISDDGKGEEKRAKIENDIVKLENALNKITKESDIYCTTLMNKYGESIKHISEKLAAGFKDLECNLSDIFVIGQHIDIDGAIGSATASGTFRENKSGEFTGLGPKEPIPSLMRGVLDSFPHDWFMGRNLDHRKYLNADLDGTRANRYVFKQSYWGYIADVDMEDLRYSEPSGIIYFKPYLVLNNANEDDPIHPALVDGAVLTGDPEQDKGAYDPDYTFVKQCRERVNDAVPGANLWETVRLKHLSESAREDAIAGIDKHYGELNAGIGFEGLANLTKMANGQGEFNPTVDLKASADIANYVANAMGYPSYIELLYDFSPLGLFSTRDVVRALKDSEEYQTNIESRLPLFAEFGYLGHSNDCESQYSGEMYRSDSDSRIAEAFNDDYKVQNNEYSSVTNPRVNVDSINTSSTMTNEDALERIREMKAQRRANEERRIEQEQQKKESIAGQSQTLSLNQLNDRDLTFIAKLILSYSEVYAELNEANKSRAVSGMIQILKEERL